MLECSAVNLPLVSAGALSACWGKNQPWLWVSANRVPALLLRPQHSRDELIFPHQIWGKKCLKNAKWTWDFYKIDFSTYHALFICFKKIKTGCSQGGKYISFLKNAFFFNLPDFAQEFKTFPSTRRGQSGLKTTVPSSDM